MKKALLALMIIWALSFGLCACERDASKQADNNEQTTWQDQYDLAIRCLSEGNYEEAIIAFTAAIEIDSKQASAYVGRGNAYILSDETEENLAAAHSNYEMAIALDETYEEAYLGLARLYTKNENTEKALEILNQALLKTGESDQIRSLIAELEETIKGSEESTESVEQGQTLDEELSEMGLSTAKLCDGVWVNEGIRYTSTFVYEFQLDGVVLTSSPAFPNDELRTESYSVKDGVITLSGEFSEGQFSYDAKKNILVSATQVSYVEMPEGDEYGNGFPGKEVALILQPYDRNPYQDGQAQSKSITPAEFADENIKQTVRPYLEALSSIDYPHKYCDINYDDFILGEYEQPYYRVTNYSDVQQVTAAVRPYVTAEYLNAHFSSSWFQSYDGKLYLLEPEMGIDVRDANSVAYGGFIGDNEVAIYVDEYGSGDNYCGTRTIYLQESGNGYVVSGLSWSCTNKGYPEYDYTPPGYDPI